MKDLYPSRERNSRRLYFKGLFAEATISCRNNQDSSFRHAITKRHSALSSGGLCPLTPHRGQRLCHLDPRVLSLCKEYTTLRSYIKLLHKFRHWPSDLFLQSWVKLVVKQTFKVLITAPDRTQLNSTGFRAMISAIYWLSWVRSNAQRCDHNLELTQLNCSTVVESSVILNIWLCVQLSWVEFVVMITAPQTQLDLNQVTNSVLTQFSVSPRRRSK